MDMPDYLDKLDRFEKNNENLLNIIL